jgi:single-strand DNA-binding protein
MNGLPTITMSGNLTADAELRFTPAGLAIATFNVACTPRVLDKQTNEWRDGDTTFLRCMAWRTLAENVAESLTKGVRVLVTGRLKQRSYEARDGSNRTVFEVDVDDVGLSLRNATAKVANAGRSSGGGFGAADDDQWSSVSGSSNFSDEPPF